MWHCSDTGRSDEAVRLLRLLRLLTSEPVGAFVPLRRLRWSLSTQLVVATLLAVLPLVVAVSYAALSLDRQVHEQQRLVLSMATLNQLTVSVAEQVKELERTARQYRLLREPRFLERYGTHLEGLARNHETLAAMRGLDEESELLRRMLGLMQSLGARLAPERSGEGAVEGEMRDLQPLLQQAYGLSDEFGGQIEARLRASLAAGEGQFDRTLRHLFIIGALAIPGTIFLVTIGTLAIAAPIRRLARAIRDIGHRRWQEPVAIGGPAEMLELGERLDWMRRKLVVSENRSQALSQHITHELKGPLAAITEAGALLAEGVPGELTSAQQRVIDILRSNAAHLHELILQLISYGAANQRDGRDAGQPVDLQALCSAQRTRLEETVDDRRIRWRFPPAVLTQRFLHRPRRC